ncbi:MAG TPA: hypothetical protein VE825_04445 [Terriglobales bacterium]|jgi:hypothetical protein|nr:hypothetical protein [Terriglobales bacterium]
MTRTAALAVVLSLYPVLALAQYAPQYPPARTASAAGPAAASAAPAATPAASATTVAADPSSLLTQISQASQATQQDLAALQISRWKTDSSSKEQLQQQSTALQRNLAAALPELMTQVRAHPDDLAASFKLYRNLNALYDVLVPLADASGRVGAQGDYDTLARDASAFDGARRAFADRLESLAVARDAEVTKLRAQVQAATATPVASKGKVVIDDSTSTKTAKKKKTTKKASTSKPAATTQPQQ